MNDGFFRPFQFFDHTGERRRDYSDEDERDLEQFRLDPAERL
jgi:hypothetical protein